MIRVPLAVCVSLLASAHAAADGLEFHIVGPKWGPQPGSTYAVWLYANTPAMGTSIPWTTMGGTGQAGHMAGFSSAIFNISASVGTWSEIAVAPGLMGPPFGSAGTIAGSSVNNIQAGIGFSAPLPQTRNLLWTGTLTLPMSPLPPQLTLDTLFIPVGASPLGPYQGLEVGLDDVVPGLLVTHYLTASTNAHATFPLPAPGVLAAGALGVIAVARRRR